MLILGLIILQIVHQKGKRKKFVRNILGAFYLKLHINLNISIITATAKLSAITTNRIITYLILLLGHEANICDVYCSTHFSNNTILSNMHFLIFYV